MVVAAFASLEQRQSVVEELLAVAGSNIVVVVEFAAAGAKFAASLELDVEFVVSELAAVAGSEPAFESAAVGTFVGQPA